MSSLPARLRPPPRRASTTLGAAAVALSLLAACASEPAPAAAPATAAPSPSAIVATKAPAVRSTVPAVPKGPTSDPLTGRTKVPRGAVVAIKIDNSPLARPFTRGLGEASIVYQELMEGGSTRFLAVFAPATGNEVGPIRSVREGDVELLQQFGKIALGSSGGNTGVLATVAKAAKDGKMLDASFDVLPGPYRKGERRKDAINFFTSPQKIDKARPSGTPPRDIGLRFRPLAPGAGFPAARATVAFSPGSRVRVDYDAKGGRYAVFQDGMRMKGFAPANVVVQHVQIRNSRYVDVLGNPTPYTSTIGKGAVAVLRDGRRLSGTWRRLGESTGTRFLDDKGRDLPLHAGATLVLLVPSGRPLQIG